MTSVSDTLLRHAGSVPVDLSAMCDEFGLPLDYERLANGIAGKLTRDPFSRSGFRVVVNKSDPVYRQRFTIAHEIAHYVLHRDLIADGLEDNTLYRSKALDEGFERQADKFAAQILLPAEAIKTAYRTDKALGSLSNKFQVSTEAVRIRLKELRLDP